MGRTKELLERQQLEALEELADDADLTAAIAAAEEVEARRKEERRAQEREWERGHRREWAEWKRILPRLSFSHDFGTGGRAYDFSDFLDDPGPAPSPKRKHFIALKDKSGGYDKGNLKWVKRRPKTAARPVDSPYLTVDEAAAYCHRSRKTILNWHSLGIIRSVPNTRPPLFRREDLDAGLAARRKRRR
jgi:hypothetical protein